MDVIVEKHTDQPSVQQNRYLWGVVYEIIATDTGMDREDVHQWCKKRFLGTRIVEIKGERYDIIRSTTELTREDFFEKYVEPIRAWYAAFGDYIPDPNEVYLKGDVEADQPAEESPTLDPIELPEEQEEIDVRQIPF